MLIEEKDYRLTPINDHSPFFDLELLYTIKPKGKESRQEFRIAAYGVSLETAIKQITQHRVLSKYEDQTIDLISYFSEFKKELDSIKTSLGI